MCFKPQAAVPTNSLASVRIRMLATHAFISSSGRKIHVIFAEAHVKVCTSAST